MKKLNRRSFLKASARGIAGVTTWAVSAEHLDAAVRKDAKAESSKDVSELSRQIPDFKFNASGKFKVMQITDTHLSGCMIVMRAD